MKPNYVGIGKTFLSNLAEETENYLCKIISIGSNGKNKFVVAHYSNKINPEMLAIFLSPSGLIDELQFLYYVDEMLYKDKDIVVYHTRDGETITLNINLNNIK